MVRMMTRAALGVGGWCMATIDGVDGWTKAAVILSGFLLFSIGEYGLTVMEEAEAKR